MTVLTLTTGTVLHHVARRADHRARHRQRHVADHLRRHRRRLAARGACRRSIRCGPGSSACIRMLFLLVLMALVVAAIIFVERGHRRVTVQYAKRVVGRRMYGGSSTHIPLKVNTGGVIPVIFASSILAFPATIAGDVPRAAGSTRSIDAARLRACRSTTCCTWPASSSSPTSTPRSSSTRMTWRRTCGSTAGSSRASGPGKRTAEYIDTILTRITLAGAIYLALIAILPEFLISGFKVAPIPFIGELARRGAAAVHHRGPERARSSSAARRC